MIVITVDYTNIRIVFYAKIIVCKKHIFRTA